MIKILMSHLLIFKLKTQRMLGCCLMLWLYRTCISSYHFALLMLTLKFWCQSLLILENHPNKETKESCLSWWWRWRWIPCLRRQFDKWNYDCSCKKVMQGIKLRLIHEYIRYNNVLIITSVSVSRAVTTYEATEATASDRIWLYIIIFVHFFIFFI